MLYAKSEELLQKKTVQQKIAAPSFVWRPQ